MAGARMRGHATGADDGMAWTVEALVDRPSRMRGDARPLFSEHGGEEAGGAWEERHERGRSGWCGIHTNAGSRDPAALRPF